MQTYYNADSTKRKVDCEINRVSYESDCTLIVKYVIILPKFCRNEVILCVKRWLQEIGK